jgi:putative ABC transport system ATP-binding protein
MRDHVVKIKNVSKLFTTKSGPLELFKNVSIDFWGSTSYALIGESGVGKSTLLHIASGLEKPSSGKVFIGDDNFWELKTASQSFIRLNETAIIFQQYNLIPCLNVRENIEFQSRINKKYDAGVIETLIEDLDIGRLLNELPDNLSGGEQQRVAIARALAARPKILFADEPTGSLDEKNSKLVLDMLLRVKEKFNTSLVVVTHSRAVASKLEVCLELKSGKISKK